MSGLTSYSVDSNVRKRAILVIAIIAATLAILFNLTFIPFLKRLAVDILGQEMVDVLGAAGLVSFGGIGMLALFGMIWKTFDLWLWKTPPFQAIHGIPNLNGEWQGELTSSYRDDSGNNVSCTMKLIVTQTFSSMQCISIYSSSSSCSSMAGIRECNTKARSCLLEYSYGNAAGEKSVLEENWESEHLGFSRIRCIDNKMEGQYFTNRTPGTKGTFTLRRQPRR